MTDFCNGIGTLQPFFYYSGSVYKILSISLNSIRKISKDNKLICVKTYYILQVWACKVIWICKVEWVCRVEWACRTEEWWACSQEIWVCNREWWATIRSKDRAFDEDTRLTHPDSRTLDNEQFWGSTVETIPPNSQATKYVLITTWMNRTHSF